MPKFTDAELVDLIETYRASHVSDTWILDKILADILIRQPNEEVDFFGPSAGSQAFRRYVAPEPIVRRAETIAQRGLGTSGRVINTPSNRFGTPDPAFVPNAAPTDDADHAARRLLAREIVERRRPALDMLAPYDGPVTTYATPCCDCWTRDRGMPHIVGSCTHEKCREHAGNERGFNVCRPEVGMPATFGIGSNSYEAIISWVSPSGSRLRFTRNAKNLEDAQLIGKGESATRQADGKYRPRSGYLALGRALYHRDPSL